jgi:hypothetical protein
MDAQDWISTLAPIGIPLISVLEKKFGPGTGDIKGSIAKSVLSVFAQLLAGQKKGPTPDAVPSDTDIARTMEAILAAMKSVPGAMPTPTPTQGTFPSVVTLPGGSLVFGLNGTLTAVNQK